MKLKQTESLFRSLILLAFLATSCGSAWAASSNCSYSNGTKADGTEIGGTVVAKGTGMGGTGISPETGMRIAGQVISVRGDVEAQINALSRPLAKDDPVCVGETLVTSKSATLHIKMTDGGLVAIRPETRFKIEKFAFNETALDTSLFSLIQGAGRFVTGKIGKSHPENDLIQTSTAIIGVRGTDHEVMVLLHGDSRNPAGTYDKVNKGITFIRTEKGEIDIHPNQVGVAVSAEKMPFLLDGIPNFYKNDPAVNEEDSVFEAEKNESGRNNHGAIIDKNTGKPDEIILPEASAKPEMPILPEIPGRPEPPALPSMPNAPAIPSMPNVPAIPGKK